MAHCVMQTPMDNLLPLIREQLEMGHSVRFSPKGISMLPLLRQTRDSVEISPLPQELKKYDIVLYQRPDGQCVLHRILAVGDSYTCLGDNQFVLERGVERDWMIGLVTAFYRDQKRHSVGECWYWLYCRVWHGSRPLRHLWRRGIGWLRRRWK